MIRILISSNETKTYTYDGLGQLTKTVTTDHKKNDQKKTVTYTYDKAGNRTKEDDGTTQTAYTYNGLDQLKTATKAKGTAVDEVNLIHRICMFIVLVIR